MTTMQGQKRGAPPYHFKMKSPTSLRLPTGQGGAGEVW